MNDVEDHAHTVVLNVLTEPVQYFTALVFGVSDSRSLASKTNRVQSLHRQWYSKALGTLVEVALYSTMLIFGLLIMQETCENPHIAPFCIVYASIGFLATLIGMAKFYVEYNKLLPAAQSGNDKTWYVHRIRLLPVSAPMSL